MQRNRPFRETETHGIVTGAGNRQRISSDGQAWVSLYASAQREVPYEGRFDAVPDQLLVLHRSGPARLERADEDRIRFFRIPAGGVHLYPGGMPFNVRLIDELDTMHVYLRRAVIEEIAADMVAGDPFAVAIPPEIVEEDALLRHMLDAVHLALGEGEAVSAIYIDCLARAIAAHLVRRYSGAHLRPPGKAGADADLARAIDFMHAHLGAPIRLADLARAVGRSPSHLGRRFREELGMPPHAYLVELRLEAARRLLERTSEPIAAIALDCGFAHQEHLTRAFGRRYGSTPAAWRRGARH